MKKLTEKELLLVLGGDDPVEPPVEPTEPELGKKENPFAPTTCYIP